MSFSVSGGTLTLAIIHAYGIIRICLHVHFDNAICPAGPACRYMCGFVCVLCVWVFVAVCICVCATHSSASQRCHFTPCCLSHSDCQLSCSPLIVLSFSRLLSYLSFTQPATQPLLLSIICQIALRWLSAAVSHSGYLLIHFMHLCNDPLLSSFVKNATPSPSHRLARTFTLHAFFFNHLVWIFKQLGELSAPPNEIWDDLRAV